MLHIDTNSPIFLRISSHPQGDVNAEKTQNFTHCVKNSKVSANNNYIIESLLITLCDFKLLTFYL